MLDQARTKRNCSEYEGELVVDESSIEAMIRVAYEIEKRVMALEPISAD